MATIKNVLRYLWINSEQTMAIIMLVWGAREGRPELIAVSIFLSCIHHVRKDIRELRAEIKGPK